MSVKKELPTVIGNIVLEYLSFQDIIDAIEKGNLRPLTVNRYIRKIDQNLNIRLSRKDFPCDVNEIKLRLFVIDKFTKLGGVLRQSSLKNFNIKTLIENSIKLKDDNNWYYFSEKYFQWCSEIKSELDRKIFVLKGKNFITEKACQYGCLKLLKYMLRKYDKFPKISYFGEISTRYDRLGAIKILFRYSEEKKLSFSSRQFFCNNILKTACRYGYYRIVSWVSNLPFQGEYRDAINISCKNNHNNISHFLMLKFNPNPVDWIQSCFEGNNKGMLKYYLDYNKEVNIFKLLNDNFRPRGALALDLFFRLQDVHKDVHINVIHSDISFYLLSEYGEELELEEIIELVPIFMANPRDLEILDRLIIKKYEEKYSDNKEISGLNILVRSDLNHDFLRLWFQKSLNDNYYYFFEKMIELSEDLYNIVDMLEFIDPLIDKKQNKTLEKLVSYLEIKKVKIKYYSYLQISVCDNNLDAFKIFLRRVDLEIDKLVKYIRICTKAGYLDFIYFFIKQKKVTINEIINIFLRSYYISINKDLNSLFIESQEFLNETKKSGKITSIASIASIEENIVNFLIQTSPDNIFKFLMSFLEHYSIEINIVKRKITMLLKGKELKTSKIFQNFSIKKYENFLNGLKANIKKYQNEKEENFLTKIIETGNRKNLKNFRKPGDLKRFLKLSKNKNQIEIYLYLQKLHTNKNINFISGIASFLEMF